MSEAALKHTVTDYLQYQMNLGELLFIRLNAGDFIEVRGTTRRRVKGAPAGCPDLLILKGGRTIFVELKAVKGKVSLAQVEFARAVTAQGAEWFEVRDFEGLLAVMGGTCIWGGRS